jgi:MFS family permease
MRNREGVVLNPVSSNSGLINPNVESGLPRISWFVIQITIIASIGGILFGYDLGVISGALPQLTTTFDLSSSQQELAVSILYLGGGIGASLGGSLCDSIGRKQTILLTDIVFGAGAIILYAAPTFAWVVFGRIVVGFSVAVSGIADVSYLHEIAPVHVRYVSVPCYLLFDTGNDFDIVLKCSMGSQLLLAFCCLFG